MSAQRTVGHVFAYGSLAGQLSGLKAPPIAWLGGYRRSWNVAMDNSRSLPGYKYYLDPRTGQRPAVFVTFVNVIEQQDAECPGVLLTVDREQLAALDRRERNYERVEVGGLVRTAVPAAPSVPIWLYRGTEPARRRFQDAQKRGLAVVERGYADAVQEGFRDLGLLDQYRRSTDRPACPIRALERVELV